MNEETIRLLDGVNRRFYRDHGEAFAATRRAPWPGWERVVLRWRETATEGTGAAVLDVGCGDGRFGRFLLERDPSIRYVGVDADGASLRRARAAFGDARGVVLVRRNVVADPFASFSAPPLDGSFALVVAFGLLHHVPSFARRRRLVDALAARLAPGGLLALAFWRFGRFERFERRRRAWSALETPPDVGELEPGDALLAWGGEAGGLVYCHDIDAEERERLLAPLELERVESFVDDGEGRSLNRYELLRRAS